ncbi:MAG: DUF3048 domain-containing protein [Coriobacteriales bacterium]|nr:DUF3048 domain-containing protein [Coriobacteriales bacterium]
MRLISAKDKSYKQESLRGTYVTKSKTLAMMVSIVLVTSLFFMTACQKQEEIVAPNIETPIIEKEIPEAPKPTTFPLTGLAVSADGKASDAEISDAIHRRPISVKLGNTPDARPQAGVGQADIVYETLTEGGITRFNCIFQSYLPAEVGPVRSARNSDITIVPQYQSLLFFSGANDLVLAQIAAEGLPNMVHGNAAEIYYRVDYRVAPHNLYLKLQDAYDAAKANGHDITVTNVPTLNFRSATSKAPAGATAASNIVIPFSDSYVAQWQWDAAANNGSGGWLRSMDGASTDATTGEQIAPANVVVMWGNYLPDNAGGTTLEINVKGEEKASLFLDGIRIDGKWKTDGTVPPKFFDNDGNEIALTLGKTWFEVVQNGTQITVH